MTRSFGNHLDHLLEVKGYDTDKKIYFAPRGWDRKHKAKAIAALRGEVSS